MEFFPGHDIVSWTQRQGYTSTSALWVSTSDVDQHVLSPLHRSADWGGREIGYYELIQKLSLLIKGTATFRMRFGACGEVGD